MTLQDKMIGEHPSDGIFCNWTDCLDTTCTTTKRHRHLKENNISRKEAIQITADWLITYHLSDSKKYMLENKRKILNKYDFQEYANSLHILPRTDKTKKGNLGEVILSQYLSQTSSIEVLVYKLRYNSNVDQSMKGDDVLLVNNQKILLGESKFRATPSKQAVESACELMGKTLALPISLGFIADRLFEQGQIKLSEQIMDIQLKLSKSNFDIKNVGFILSTKLINKYAENNLVAPNKDFILISFGMDDPVGFMNMAFDRAEKLLLEVPEDES